MAVSMYIQWKHRKLSDPDRLWSCDLLNCKVSDSICSCSLFTAIVTLIFTVGVIIFYELYMKGVTQADGTSDPELSLIFRTSGSILLSHCSFGIYIYWCRGQCLLFYFLSGFFDTAFLSLACEEHVQDLLREGAALSASVVLTKQFFIM